MIYDLAALVSCLFLAAEKEEPEDDCGETDADAEADAAELHLEALPGGEGDGDFLDLGNFDATDAVDEVWDAEDEGLVRPNGQGVVKLNSIPSSPCVGIGIGEERDGGGVGHRWEDGDGITIGNQGDTDKGVVYDQTIGGADFDGNVLGAASREKEKGEED